MAKQRPVITIYDAALGSTPEYADVFLISGNSRKAVFESPTSGERVIVKGQGFTYDDGIIDQGNVKSLAFIDGDAGLVQSYENFVVRAGQVSSANEIDFINGILMKINTHGLKWVGSNNGETIHGQSRDDVIAAGGGNDRLFGGEGRDRLTGGKGLDVFVVEEDGGKDVITDFDPTGGLGEQDSIDGTYPGQAAVTRSGRNTIIDFGDGDTFTLLGIKPGQIDETDFV